MTAPLNSILSEHEIRLILIGLAAARYDVAKEVETYEAKTGNPHDFGRLEYEEYSALIRKIRGA